jgi:hypothetical protein
MRVKIDGVETTLTFDSMSGSRGYQYLTPKNESSRAFSRPLEQMPWKFQTNGHVYEKITST